MSHITVLPDNRILEAQPGQSLHAVLAGGGILDAPCGGQGKCGKCRVMTNGREVLACQTQVWEDMTVLLPLPAEKRGTPQPGKRIAFDLGTTGVVCYLTDEGGNVLSQAAQTNPQTAFGADVVSRIRAALNGQQDTLTSLIRQTMQTLLLQVCSTPAEVECISVVGNPAMQQLFLGSNVENLAQIPFDPVLRKGQISSCADIFPDSPKAMLLTVPDISGFVGADTVAGILSCEQQKAEEMTLLVDIGTNGEMVLGNKAGMTACATAAGPALEGASIQFGMRAETGAIDRVWLEEGKICVSVIGGGEARGICGSGLIDAVAAALNLGLLNSRGRILTEDRKVMLTKGVCLTQEDIRQVQLAKGAIAAGIRLLAETMHISLEDIQKVVLAGAFGSVLNPESACRIGLLPEELLLKITAVGNAAGKGSILLAADPEKLALCDAIAQKTAFLELASLPAFPKTFARAMKLPQSWQHSAVAMGFSHAVPLDPAILQAREDVRAMCQADKCRSYGKNWTCPPHCGSLSDCEEKMHRYRYGILLQTVGQLSKDIDTKGYWETEQRHLESFAAFCDAIQRTYPDALCLGAGGCRICKTCAYPEACRFPEKATASMEAYGLFVTQVCRDAGIKYYYGEKTIAYTACVLYG